jgi:hypothetical protein
VIQLRSDCLVFKTPEGSIPCSVHDVAVELVGTQDLPLDPEMVRHAAAGVLHYFREELGRDLVTVGEFASALARVLRGFGFQVETEDLPAEPPATKPLSTGDSAPSLTVMETDLLRLAAETGGGFELAFFSRLRRQVEAGVGQSPSLLRFTGLRSCAKQLAGARRWSFRCQQLSDQIADYLRVCLIETCSAADCALEVR